MRRRDFLIGGLLGALAADQALAAPEPKPGSKAKQPPAKPPAKPRSIVAIDAGHGGKDPGTIGIQGTYEKDITFAVARDLARRLEATGRYQPLLTRRDAVEAGDRRLAHVDVVERRAARVERDHAPAAAGHHGQLRFVGLEEPLELVGRGLDVARVKASVFASVSRDALRIDWLTGGGGPFTSGCDAPPIT